MRERSKDKAKAIILAAGRSTRLRPLTEDIPKCLLSLGDETILDYQIRHLAKLNIERELIVVGYKRDLIVENMVYLLLLSTIKFFTRPITRIVCR